MTTSGTFAFNLDLGEVLEEAFERAGGELRSGYDYRTARRSLNLLMLEWQNRGLNLWTVKSASQTLTSGVATYALSAEKLDVVEGMIRTDAGSASSQADISMRRVSVTNYARQTNKLTQGRPIQYYVERTDTGITLNLWPVPDGATTYTFHYYYMEQIEDAGVNASITQDIPVRFLPCLTAGLAYYLAMKIPEAFVKLPSLKLIYEDQWDLAANTHREKAGFFLKPSIPK